MKFLLNFSICCILYSIFGILPVRAATIGTVTPVSTSVPKYGKFEAHFPVTTTAGNLQFPYDPAPPPGVTPQKGISVDAEFSPDNWATTYRQPAFFYQEYTNSVKDSLDWIYPNNASYWVVRFAPNANGTWQYRVTATDRDGTATSPAQSFEVTPSSSKGFIRVSPTDSRYVEYSDGTFFPGLGYNLNFNLLDWLNPIQSNRSNLQVMGKNGINFIRIWLSQWQIFGEPWNGWKYQPDGGLNSHLVYNESYGDSEISMYVNAAQNPCMFSGLWLQPSLAVKANTTYRIKVRVKTTGLSGPKIAGQPWGFVVKTGDLNWNGHKCEDPTLGTRMTTALTTNSDWTTVEGTYNPGTRNYLDGFYLTMENATAGIAYIDRVWMEENTGAWGSTPNILEEPWMAHHQYYDQRMSYAFDLALGEAEKNGVTLKPVLTEKNDWILNMMDNNGGWTGVWPDSNWPFYGNGRTMTKSRWLLQSFWRYAQARWGYSTSIHSWELLNEGDPWGTGMHYYLADEFGKYMHCTVFGQPVQATNGWKCSYNHPDSHPVTTSNWHSFPNLAFWGNSNYPNVDIADFHLYYQKNGTSTTNLDNHVTYNTSTPAIWNDTALVAKNQSDEVGALTAHGVHKPTVIGESGFTDSGSEPGTLDLMYDSNGIWIHNYLWGGIGPGGVYNAGYWYADGMHIYCNGCYVNDIKFSFDHRHEFGNYYRFFLGIPLSNGHYVDAQATASDPNLRVWGQKDTVNNRAHLWLANPNHTWKNVLDNVAITPISASVTLGGFTTANPLKVERWDTYSGVAIATTSATPVAGVLTLAVSNLTSDYALRIGDYTPAAAPKPGDFTGDGVVDWRDWLTFIPNFNQPNPAFKFAGSGLVNIFDVNKLIGLLFR